MQVNLIDVIQIICDGDSGTRDWSRRYTTIEDMERLAALAEI